MYTDRSLTSIALPLYAIREYSIHLWWLCDIYIFTGTWHRIILGKFLSKNYFDTVFFFLNMNLNCNTNLDIAYFNVFIQVLASGAKELLTDMMKHICILLCNIWSSYHMYRGWGLLQIPRQLRATVYQVFTVHKSYYNTLRIKQTIWCFN